MTRLFLLILGVLATTYSVFSQEKGFLRGNVVDGDNGEGLFGAKITLQDNPTVGALTDFDGNYSLPLAPGTYTFKLSAQMMDDQVFENIVIVAGETTILNATMFPKELGVVNVTAKAKRDGEVGLLLERKNADKVLDGMTSQTFSKNGDGDLSGAMKRVPGVTIQKNNVFVRGLGDRYTQTTLNGLVIPGLDPDRNSVQMDIFPTSLLENVAVYKTASPELYGDFTGGLVDIVTKKFPEKKTTQFSLGIGYNPAMQFNKDFILYNRGNLDWTGFDDGSRKLPFNPRTPIPDEVLVDPKLQKLTSSFNPQLGVKSKTALPNGSFGFLHGNQLNFKEGKGGTFGYNFVLNYSNEFLFYKGFESNDYLKNTDKSVTTLTRFVTRKGDVGTNRVLWSALGTASYKKGTNAYQLTLLRSQSGESTASYRMNQDYNQNVSTLVENVLTYSQRSLTTGMLSGTHRIGKTRVSWSNALSKSRVYDPDFRETRISVTDGDTSLATGSGAGIDRFWRDLNELNEAFKVDFDIPIADSGKWMLKTGAAGTMKWRDFSVYSFKIRRNDISNIEIDPDWWLQPDNIWSSDPNSPNYRNGTFVIGNYQPANTYEARQNVYAAYAALSHPLGNFIKLNYGVRVEKAAMYYSGQNNDGSKKFRDSLTLDNFNVLPSANIKFELNDTMSIRIGASQSVARPTFREKSIAQIYDPLTKRTFNGNINLRQTNIYNFDLRYEWYLSPMELISVSGFYKRFDGHIEMVSFVTSPSNLTPRNSGFASLLGAEVELRKSFVKEKRSAFWSKFFLNANVSLVQSRVDLHSIYVDDQGQTEYDMRKNNLREGETLKDYRPMAGQSPYTVNAGLSYEDQEKGTSIALNYNVQGTQLTIISSGRVPDVYTDPFHSLNLNASQKFGKEQRSKLTLGVNNLLNDRYALVYRSYGSEWQNYVAYKPGIEFNLKYSFTF